MRPSYLGNSRNSILPHGILDHRPFSQQSSICKFQKNVWVNFTTMEQKKCFGRFYHPMEQKCYSALATLTGQCI